jgi:hypothetical protein
MRSKLALVLLAGLVAGACGGDSAQPAGADGGGLALVTVRPTAAASLSQSRLASCAWCTTAFGAELTVESSRTLTGVNLWLDGWSGSRRCLYSQHDSPADGFTLAADQPVVVRFGQASVECTAPFTIDRVDVRMRAGDTLVYQGSWPVSLPFVE